MTAAKLDCNKPFGVLLFGIVLIWMIPPIGLACIIYGLAAIFVPQKVGLSSTQDRLAELLKLRNDSLISPEEYEIKRQEILKTL